jgi:hypothetical protein
VRGIIYSAQLVIWWIYIQVAANVPVLCFFGPAEPGNTWADFPNPNLCQALGYCAFMNPRAQAKHEARATLEAAKVRAERLGRMELRTAKKKDNFEEAYRSKFENNEYATLPEWYLGPRAREVRSLRFAERNLYAKELCELDSQRTALEVEAVKVEAATNTAHLRIARLIVKLIAWAKLYAARFARPDLPPEPVPIEEHPTAAPNSPNTFN